MTIYLYTGTPGSGKSLHMAQDIYWHVKMGRPVVANFEINKSMFHGKHGANSFSYVENSKLTPELLRQYAVDYFEDKPYRENAIRLYIDECQVMFSAREWAKADRKDWNIFFQQHRKMGYEIYLIAQFDTMIDKQIRAVIEYEVKHRKLNNYGWVGTLATVLALGAPVCVCVNYWYPMRERVNSSWMIGRRKFYRLYDTMRLFR